MEDSSKEQQPRCPCGFWGTQQTLGLCSKCYSEAQRSQASSSNSSTKSAKSSNSKPSLKSSFPGSGSPRAASNMDSKHFRSHSDNLPSSLSQPGERPAINTPTSVAPTVEASSSTPGKTDVKPPAEAPAAPSQLSPSSSDSSLLSDPTFDPAAPRSVASSVSVVSMPSSCSSVVSLPLSAAESTDSVATPVASGDSVCNSAQGSNENSGVVVVSQSSLAASSNKDNISALSVVSDQPASVSLPPQVAANEDKDASAEESHDQSTASRGVKRSRDEMEASAPNVPSPQKNKKRCFVCNCKLELAQRTIGRCRCDRVFCSLHRLPELHDCIFNHKEDGRREAKKKMVMPTRHLGTSFRRDDDI